VVPGHGDIMTWGVARAQLEELEAVAALARLCIFEGMPVDEAASKGPYPMGVMMSALGRALEVGDLQPADP